MKSPRRCLPLAGIHSNRCPDHRLSSLLLTCPHQLRFVFWCSATPSGIQAFWISSNAGMIGDLCNLLKASLLGIQNTPKNTPEILPGHFNTILKPFSFKIENPKEAAAFGRRPLWILYLKEDGWEMVETCFQKWCQVSLGSFFDYFWTIA